MQNQQELSKQALKVKNAAHRRLARLHKRGAPTEEETAARQELVIARLKKRAAKRAIEAAKKDSFRNLINEVENDIWGTAYRLVTKRFGKQVSPVVPDNIRLTGRYTVS